MEEDRLSFVEHSPLQQRLATDRAIRASANGDNPGKIPPASHADSPTKRKSDTEDGLAIVNRKGRPHLFITVAMNANWPEITSNLLPGESAYDRPDLCCRVCKMKLKEIVAEIRSGKVFGPYISHCGVTEFQKRGWPHARLVYTFKGNGPHDQHEMGKWVWAQIQDESIANGLLREKVLKYIYIYIVHKPCGHVNVNAPCMQLDKTTNRKKCNKKFPQPFRSTAKINDRSGRVEYTRVKTDDKNKPTVRMKVDGQYTDVPVGDEWVASYNPYLLMRFDCHINVDVVTATTCIKYLFIYCHKSEDYARARIQGITDGIELYRKTRYISAAEATWKILAYQMIDRYPAVTKLHAHLEGEQYVLFPANATQARRLELTNSTRSPLMEYFARPPQECFDNLTLLDCYEQYTVTRPKQDALLLTHAPPGKFLDSYNNAVSRRRENFAHVCCIYRVPECRRRRPFLLETVAP